MCDAHTSHELSVSPRLFCVHVIFMRTRSHDGRRHAPIIIYIDPIVAPRIDSFDSFDYLFYCMGTIRLVREGAYSRECLLLRVLVREGACTRAHTRSTQTHDTLRTVCKSAFPAPIVAPAHTTFKAHETHVEKCDRERDERERVVDLSALERPMRNKIGPTESKRRYLMILFSSHIIDT